MPIHVRTSLLLLCSALCPAAVMAQQGASPISLDVVVAPKSGAPVSGLQQADFTVLDNKVPQKILSFQAHGGPQENLEVTIVVDAVNIGIDRLNYERQQVDNFLRSHKGPFAYPMTMVAVTDTDTMIEDNFSTDSAVLAGWLDAAGIARREFVRNGDFYSDAERLQISLHAAHQILSLEAQLPGRKLVLWVSPGWPLLTGPGMVLDAKQEGQIFGDITSLTTQMVQGHITLYSIDPLGARDFGGRSFVWKEWVKPIRRARDVELANLALEVLATQSGGLALNSNNDVVAMMQQCLADTQAYYEISFDPPEGHKPGELHNLEVRVAKPGLTARTRWDYYAPSPAAPN